MKIPLKSASEKHIFMDFPHKKTVGAPASVASASDFAPKSVGLTGSETSGSGFVAGQAGQPVACPR